MTTCKDGACEINFDDAPETTDKENATFDATVIPIMTPKEAAEILKHNKFMMNISQPGMPKTVEFSAAVDIACACMEAYSQEGKGIGD